MNDKNNKLFGDLTFKDLHTPYPLSKWKEMKTPNFFAWTLTFLDDNKEYDYYEILKEFIFRDRWARENKVYPYDEASMKEKGL